MRFDDSFVSNGGLIVFDMTLSQLQLFYDDDDVLIPVNFNYLQEGIAARWQGSLNSFSPSIRYISLQVHC